MKSYILVCACLLSLHALTCRGQAPTSTPLPTTAGTPIPIRNQSLDYERSRISNPTKEAIELERENKRVMAKFIDPLYRKPTEAELAEVAIDPSIKQLFSQFLSEPGTGIIKIKPDFGCEADAPAGQASEECRRLTLPGAGNAFSFRTRNYQMSRLADLAFRGARFVTPGVLAQGIFVKIGDVPIEKLSLSDHRLQYLSSFRPADEINEVLKAEKTFETGVDIGGFRYASSAPVEINITYALRSIAYRGESVRVIQGAIFNELEYDKRRDSIVVFRTVGFERNGSLIVLWRELRNGESPKVKYPN
jgi:hypothetical protein